MSSPVVISVVMLLGLFHPYRSTVVQTYGEGDWVLTVRTDTFTRQTRCTLVNHHGHDPDVSVVPGALAFKFNPKLDTSNAWYKIDDRPPQAAHDAIAKLIATGSLAPAEQLDNPSGGVVLIPFAELTGVQAVAVEPVSLARPHLAKLEGVWAALNSAFQMKCIFRD